MSTGTATTLPVAEPRPDLGRKRALLYWVVGIGLIVLYLALRDIPWRSDASLHTLPETVSTLLALMVGVVALVRYYSRPTNSFVAKPVAHKEFAETVSDLGKYWVLVNRVPSTIRSAQ